MPTTTYYAVSQAGENKFIIQFNGDIINRTESLWAFEKIFKLLFFRENMIFEYFQTLLLYSVKEWLSLNFYEMEAGKLTLCMLKL